jgi:hypothetical protein
VYDGAVDGRKGPVHRKEAMVMKLTRKERALARKFNLPPQVAVDLCEAFDGISVDNIERLEYEYHDEDPNIAITMEWVSSRTGERYWRTYYRGVGWA